MEGLTQQQEALWEEAEKSIEQVSL